MNTLKLRFIKAVATSTLITSFAFASTAHADDLWDDALYDMVYSPAETMMTQTGKASTPVGILSYSDNFNKNSVWSYEYEEYVNPTDFTQITLANSGDVNQYMGNHPTAAGNNSHEVFIYNETAGEYHLQ